MQFDTSRAFPYPVLRPDVDDYIDGDIQATVDIKQAADESKIEATIDFALSVPEIQQLIDLGKAKFVVVFSCRDTYMRRAVMDQSNHFECWFDAGSLRGEVGIFPYVVAVENVDSFSCEWINQEFGPGPFSFYKGSVLAVERPKSVYVDRDSFKPISSAFVLVKDDGLAGAEWRVDASGDKVRIAASPDLKAKIDIARNSKKNQAILLNSIYFAAVMQCVALLKNGDGYEELRWANVFNQRCADVGLDIQADSESEIAQRLMKIPFALLETYFFNGGIDA